jgi:hypothetical protein
MHHEPNAPEHLLLHQSRQIAQRLSNALCQPFIISHSILLFLLPPGNQTVFSTHAKKLPGTKKGSFFDVGD